MLNDVYADAVWSIIPDNVSMELDYSQMTIAVVPEPAAALLLLLGAMGCLSRRPSARAERRRMMVRQR